MGTGDRAALQVCAETGDLMVSWSPYVAAEVARVATRAHVASALGEPGADPPLAVALAAMEGVRPRVDAAVHALELCWSVPSPAAMLEAASHPHGVFPDVADVPILTGAIAAGASFLLTHDQTAFPHGRGHERLAFWHPDTFLTTLFLSEPAVYARVRLLVGDAIRVGALLPHRG